MKAAVFYEPEQIQLEDVPDPTAGDDEVIVRVRACGFCGSDIEYYYGKSPLGTPDGKGPLVLGHEICGQVVQAGKLAEQYGLAEGDRVSVNPVQSCNACDMCRSGKVAFCPNMSVIGQNATLPARHMAQALLLWTGLTETRSPAASP